MRILAPLLALTLLCGTAAVPTAARAAAVPTGSGFHAVRQVRVLEATQGSSMHAHSKRRLSLTGWVPGDATAVVVNLTVVAPRHHGGFVTAWPDGTARPLTSNVNFVPGQTVANLAVVPLRGGALDLYNGSDGLSGVIVDLTGYYSSGDVAGGFAPLPPTRVLDTRRSLGTTRPASTSTHTVQIGGRAGVPVGAAAVVIDLVVTGASRAGYLSAWPAGTRRPQTSAVVFAARHDVATLAVVALDAAGRLQLYNGSAAVVDVVGDVAGYFLRQPGSAAAAGSYLPLHPARLLDTRTSRPLGSNAQRDLPVMGHAGVPASGVTAVVVTVTATGPTSSGYLKAWGWPGRPVTSVLNFARGATVANTSVLPLCAGGLSLFNQSPGSTDLLVDVVGYVAGPPPPCWRDTTPPPEPGGGAQTEYTDVSCGAPGHCVVVGDGPSGFFADTYSGATASRAALPTPSGYGANGSPLVSCPTATTCTVLRQVVATKGGVEAVVLYTQHGTGWTARIVSRRENTELFVEGYSDLDCLSLTECVAVGSSSGDPSLPPDAMWGILHAGTWTVHDTSAGVLTSVSCRAVGDCYGAGFAGGSSDQAALEHLRAGVFEPVGVPHPSGTAVRVTSIDCVTAGCLLVGTTSDSPYAATVSGDTATAVAAPPVRADAVSCLATTACRAVGADGPQLTALQWDGRGWTTAPIPAPSSGTYFPRYSALSCPSTTSCMATGTAIGIVALRSTLFGSAWASAAGPITPGPPRGRAQVVSCVPDGSCVTVGLQDNPTGVFTNYAQVRDADGVWSAARSISSLHGDDATYTALSCATATSCAAVGTDGTVPVAAVLANGTWTSTALAAPQAAGSTSVTAVSCPAPGSCVAAGVIDGHPALWRLAAGHWDAQVLDRSGVFDAISCVSTTRCVTLGRYDGDSGTDVTTFTGTSSKSQHLASPQGGLSDISCVSADECAAVGDDGFAHLHDGVWDTVGSVSGSSISCAAPGECTIVSFSGPNQTAVFRLVDGTLQLPPTVLTPPSGEQYASLVDVSCSAADRCLAVGSKESISGTAHLLPWAEVYATGPQ